jgi:hypothetical protein
MIERPATPRAERVTLPLILGGAFSAALTGVAAANTACDAIGAAIFGALIAGVAFITIRRFLRPHVRRVAQFCVPVVVAVAMFVCLSSNSNDVFESAFGIRTPAGVRELRADRRYAGGPGDTTTVIRFVADQATIDALLKPRSFTADDQALSEWRRQGNWQRLCYELFGNFSELGAEHGGRPSVIPPMGEPHVYVYKSQEAGQANESGVLLWDAATGQAYVQWLFG